MVGSRKNERRPNLEWGAAADLKDAVAVLWTLIEWPRNVDRKRMAIEDLAHVPHFILEFELRVSAAASRIGKIEGLERLFGPDGF